MVLESGGSAANTAVVLAQLGASTRLLGCLGRDQWARVARARLEAAGVDLSSLQETETDETGLMFVPVTPDGQRTLFGRRAANRFLDVEALPLNEVGAADALHVSGYAFLAPASRRAASRALRAAAEGNTLTSMDTAYEPPFEGPDHLREALEDIDVLILGQQEAEALSGLEGGRAAGWFFARGVKTLAIKLGSRGARVHGSDGAWDIPAFPVETVDTTGAGDAFSAALLYGLLTGCSPPAAALLAAAAGAAATTVWGAGAAFPGKEKVHQILLSTATTIPSELQEPHAEALDQIGNSAAGSTPLDGEV